MKKLRINVFLFLFNLNIFRNIFCIFFVFYIFYSFFAIAVEEYKPLDFSGDSPLYLTKKHIIEDLTETKNILKENYVLYLVLKKSEMELDLILDKLAEKLLNNKTPILTHHFQKELINTFDFTEDSNLRTDFFLNKRHYIQKVEPKVPFYSGIILAKHKDLYRVIPNSGAEKKIVNFWFVKCSSKKEVLFPILPNRYSENLFMLGVHSNRKENSLNCEFKNDSGNKQKIEIPLLIREVELNQSKIPIYKYNSFRTPYLRWYRDGKKEEIEVKNFYKLARKLRKSRTLIIDVRGNKFGSFYFIEKWLKEYTKNHWKNVFLKERQTIPILKGLINRVQWNFFNTNEKFLIGKEQLEQKRSQLRALIKHFKEKEILEKWIETKFIFNGEKSSPEWQTKLIVIANNHCGNGCQFLAALTKQIPNGTLIGTNTGPFSKNISGPIFQLKNSKIMISFSNRIQIDHLGNTVSPLGYLPDYWLFPPMGEKEIQKFATKIN
tara:strand:- start:2862 stop:4337 length:1476 start_codon:yes stop_codon:yes gene_type:complete